MALTTVASYAVCANHAHLVDANDEMRKLVNAKQAEGVTFAEVHDPLHFCACGKPAFWLLRAVRVAVAESLGICFVCGYGAADPAPKLTPAERVEVKLRKAGMASGDLFAEQA